MKNTARLTILTAAVTLLVGGCGSGDPNDVSYSAITGNLTPELMGLAERPIDKHRNAAVHANQNIRMAWDDLARAFYLNNPSKMSPYPVFPSGGIPH